MQEDRQLRILTPKGELLVLPLVKCLEAMEDLVKTANTYSLHRLIPDCSVQHALVETKVIQETYISNTGTHGPHDHNHPGFKLPGEKAWYDES
jgi:hypothetical protein